MHYRNHFIFQARDGIQNLVQFCGHGKLYKRQSQVKPEQTKAKQTKPSQAKPNQAKPSQTKPNQANPTQPKLQKNKDGHISASYAA